MNRDGLRLPSKRTCSSGCGPPAGPKSVLEVGCGTGLFLEWFAQGGHQVTGLDPSPYMLNLARRRVPERVALDRGYAEDLPYEDNAFDTVALITTLEFVNDPIPRPPGSTESGSAPCSPRGLEQVLGSHMAALFATALETFHLQPCALLQRFSALAA